MGIFDDLKKNNSKELDSVNFEPSLIVFQKPKPDHKKPETQNLKKPVNPKMF